MPPRAADAAASNARRQVFASLAACALLAACQAPAVPASDVRVFRGARLILGDGRPAVEPGAFVIAGERITAIGSADTLSVPAGATVIELAGKTVMPALVDGHSHLGYTNVATMTTGAAEYTRDNLLDHLRRYAYYGIGATLSLGLDRGDLPYQLRAETGADRARFLTTGRGIAMPNAGPRAEHWKDAAYGVTTEAAARAAVRELAARKVDMVKIWVDDRDGTVAPLPPSLYQPIIEESHALGLRVVAHVYYLADAKSLLRAGIDGFAHGIRDKDVDEELVALFRARPHVFLLPNLPDRQPARADLDLLAETLPPDEIERLRRSSEDTPPRPRLFDVQARNLKRLRDAGVTIGFGTDAGIGSPYGWSAHEELADMVTAGLTPSQAIVAATRTTAEILRLDRLGTLAEGKSADFIVLDANPLDDIRNTRRIAQVYLRGTAVDRAGLRARWTGGRAATASP